MQPTHSNDVGLAADLETIDGRFRCFMLERRYAECTIVSYQAKLRDYARWLAVRGRRLTDLSLEDVPYVVRYHSLGRCETCKEERRAVLRVWLRFTDRFRRKPTRTAWQGWLDDHLHFLATHKGHVAATLEVRRIVVGGYLTWQFGRRPADWSRVGPRDIIGYARYLAARGLRRTTLKGWLSAFRQFLRFIMIRGVGKSELVDAVPSVSTYGQSAPRPAILTDEQRRRLLRSFPHGPGGDFRRIPLVGLRRQDPQQTHAAAFPPRRRAGLPGCGLSA